MAPKPAQGKSSAAGPPAALEDISGVREQIIANAVRIFPKLIVDSKSTTPNLSPGNLFNVVLQKDDYSANYQASIVQNDPAHHDALIQGPLMQTVQGALFELLDAICFVIDDHGDILRRATGANSMDLAGGGNMNKNVFAANLNWVKQFKHESQASSA